MVRLILAKGRRPLGKKAAKKRSHLIAKCPSVLVMASLKFPSLDLLSFIFRDESSR